MTNDDLEMDDKTHEAIKELCAAGDRLASEGNYLQAVNEYGEAWELIPAPKTTWVAATWVLTAIADACFLGGKINDARGALEYVMHCPDAIGNPFIHLRYGEVLFEEGEMDASADQLMRAYMIGGIEIFNSENPKYIEFLKTRAQDIR